MYCKYCGARLPEDAAYCPGCGVRLQTETAQPPLPAEAAAQQNEQTAAPQNGAVQQNERLGEQPDAAAQPCGQGSGQTHEAAPSTPPAVWAAKPTASLLHCRWRTPSAWRAEPITYFQTK